MIFMDYTRQITEYRDEEISILNKIDIRKISDAVNLILEVHKNEKRAFIFGNGGSAATASHFLNDFNKGLSERLEKKFHFVCLNDNIPTMMAVANDIGYEEIFSFQLKGQMQEGDIVIALSGSGNSRNVVNAAEYAKTMGNQIIGLTGYDGGKLGTLSDINLHVPVNNMQIVEDIHMFFDHLLMSVFRKILLGEGNVR
jgi:D-sedoheptulose 7-phosphate isomerase